MTPKELQYRAEKVEWAIKGLEVMDAVDVIRTAINISSKKNKAHALINICAIDKMIESMHAAKGLSRSRGTVRYRSR